MGGNGMERNSAAANAWFDDIKTVVDAGDYSRAADMIAHAVAERGDFSDGGNIDLAHWLVLGANWNLIARLLPKGTNGLLTGGWLNSIAAGRPADAKGGALPWLTYAAIDFIEGVSRADWRVFEWGSGASTAWWSARAAAVEAIEHDRRYYDQVASFGLANATLHLHEDPAAYVGAIAAGGGGPFDAIVIDGEARDACARAAPAHLKPGGILVFDDSDRAQHRASLLTLGEAGLRRIDFFGLAPCHLYRKCTSVFFADAAILAAAPLPGDKRSCLGPTVSQAVGE